MTFRITDLPIDIVKFNICRFLTTENRELAKIFQNNDLTYINNYYNYTKITDEKQARKVICLDGFDDSGIDINEFKNVESLECKYLSKPGKISLSKLSKLNKLSGISATEIYLTELQNLESLELYVNIPVIDLKEFKKLKSLSLNLKTGSSIKNLETLNNLKTLKISDVDNPTAFKIPNNITKLEYNSSHRIIFNFALFTKLEFLEFGSKFNQPVFVGDDSILKYLPNLKTFSLINYRYEYPIDGLKYLTKLKSLTISSPVEITELEYLTNLEYLNIYYYEGKLRGLWGLKKLKHLKLPEYERIEIIEREDMHLDNLEYFDARFTFNRPLDFLKTAKNLKSLYVGNSFNHSIPFEYFKNLEEISFCLDPELQPLYTSEDPGIRYLSKLKKIEIQYCNRNDGEICNFPPLNFFPELEHLELYFPINQPLQGLKYMKKLKYMRINICDHPMPELKYLNNLEHLEIYGDFNQPIPELKYLTNLEYLGIQGNFNQPIPELKYLTNLEYLRICGKFNQPVPELQYLTKLKTLRFGDSFNQHISDAKYLVNLEVLKLGRIFNHPLPILKYLTNLKVLIFSIYYNQPIFEGTDSIILGRIQVMRVIHTFE